MNSMQHGPRNTAKVAPEMHFLGMLDGGATQYITDMEAQGQREVVNSSALPITGPWDELEALGFAKGAVIDELFVQATLPPGWSKEGSDHAMHSYVIDERGVQRVNVFYKAAFYDRRADMYLMNPGYSASTHALYGDEPPALPDKWAVFTDDERANFVAGLDRMARDITETPSIYGKHAPRLAAIRALLAAGA